MCTKQKCLLICKKKKKNASLTFQKFTRSAKKGLHKPKQNKKSKNISQKMENVYLFTI